MFHNHLPMQAGAYQNTLWVAAAAKARRGDGPTILWMDLDRLSSHTSSDDHRVYRNLADIEAMADRVVRMRSGAIVEVHRNARRTPAAELEW